MGKAIESPRPIKYANPKPAATRETSISTAVLLITNLLRCVVWLIRQGVFITGFRGWQSNGVDHVVVTVACSPYLHRLFEGRCAWRKRRQEGALTIYTWFVDRFGVRIEWEEVSCA